MIGEFLFIGLISGLLGLFYRNCLKKREMIFHPIYRILLKWVRDGQYCRDWPREAALEGYDKMAWRVFLAWIAYPLGYCIYCSTTWISIFIYTLYLCSWEELPSWHWIVIGLITVMGLSHLIAACSCKWILKNHPDLAEFPDT